jgi:hypothetical protein
MPGRVVSMRRGTNRISLVRALAALAVALITAALLAAPAPARRVRSGTCERHRAHAIVVTPHVLVYRAFPHGTPHPPADPVILFDRVFYACLRPRGSPIRIGETPGTNDTVANFSVRNFRAAGTYVAARRQVGEGDFAACEHFGPPPPGAPQCTPPNYWIRLIELRSRRSLDIPTNGDINGYVLSARGAVAWTQTTNAGTVLSAAVARSADGGPLTSIPQALDSGHIPVRSLHFTGLTLHWTRDGHPLARALH